MLRVIQRNRAVFLGILFSVFFSAHSAFAANPGTPISPGDNIQDPGALSTPWGGCGPIDSNCYVTVISGGSTNWDTIGDPSAGANIAFGSTAQTITSTATTQNALTFIGNSMTTGRLLGLTSTAAYTGTGLFNITANSATTGNIASISGSGLTSGSALSISGRQEDTSGTGGLFKSVATINGTAASTYNNNLYISTTNSNTTNSNVAIGIFNELTDNTNLDNNSYGSFTQVTTSGSGNKTIRGSASYLNSTGTGSETLLGHEVSVTATGATTIGRGLYGLDITSNSTGSNGGSTDVYGARINSGGTVTSGDINTYGLFIYDGDSDVVGNSTEYGIYVQAQTGADNSYSAVFVGGNFGIGDVTPASLFTVGNGDLFQVDSSGKVGIGTAPTASLLTLDKTGGTTLNVGLGTIAGDYGQLTFQGNAANNETLGWLTFNNNAPNGGVGATIDVLHEGGGAVDNKTYIMFSTDNGTSLDERIRISAAGRLGIGDSSPDYLLDVENTSTDGNIFALHDSDGECLYNPEAGSVTVSCSSDERLKTNIVDAASVLDYLDSFKIREYDVLASNDHMTGVIAQEVLQNHPELVTQNVDGMYSVQLPSQWKLVKGIQEVNMKILSITSLAEGEGSFVGTLRAWLANAGNHITRIFTGEICLTDERGSSECLNKSQLGQLKQLLNNPASSQAVIPIEQPETPSENIDVVPAVENELNNETQ